MNAGALERLPVTLSLEITGLSPASLAPMAVPADASTAEVAMYLTDGADGRTFDQTVSLTLADPTAEVELLAGEVYDFELSLKNDAGTEVAFDLEQRTIVPDLTVRFEPTTIIDQVQQGSTYYDGAYLIVPIEVLTPAGGIAPHTDYELTVTATGGTISTQGLLGIEVVPDGASSPVTIDVTATGLLASRETGPVSAQFEITPSSVTPGSMVVDADLVAPSITITTSSADISVGGSRYINVEASDDTSITNILVYENMEQKTNRCINNRSYSSSQFYAFSPTEARTYMIHVVAVDSYGNIGTDSIRIRAK